MRIPLTDRFNLKYVLMFATGLFLVQLVEGTNGTFALLTFAYICIFAVGYNVAGGIFYPSGAWIFFTAVECALIGLVFKALLGQPAEAGLVEPNTTMAVYCVGLAGMGVAAWASRTLRPKAGLLANLSAGDKMKQSAAGCLILSIVIFFGTEGFNQQAATFSTAIAQINHFGELAILLGTTYQIAKSGGRSSSNWIVWTSGLCWTSYGVLGFSKTGMFQPFTIWLLAAIVLGYNFSKMQLILGAAFLGFMFYYMVPYSQYGRQDRDPTNNISQSFAASEKYLLDLSGTREAYLSSSAVLQASELPHFYKESEGFFDRLQMFAIDDALIARTDVAGVYGLAPMQQAFLNVIPRFLWKDKPVWEAGNDYGREIGVIGDYDETTGISFSSTADAYHEAKWPGVLIMEPLLMFMLFFIADSVSGDMRKSPWGLLYLALFVHNAPEGVLPTTVYLSGISTLSVVAAAIISGRVIPYLVGLVSAGRPGGGPAVTFSSRGGRPVGGGVGTKAPGTVLP